MTIFAKKNKLKLVIDIGNTLTKTAVFDGNQILYFNASKKINIKLIENLLRDYSLRRAILCSVRDYPVILKDFLKHHLSFIELDEKTAVPIKIKYSTVGTLGKDRLAAAVAANNIFPGNNVLVINAGTCITYDFINKKSEYIGGAISPGVEMRFKALNTFTDKLPLIKGKKNAPIIGNNTKDSILSGVVNGAIFEIDGVIDNYYKNFEELKVILSGGDMKYFDKKLKNSIFALSNIVLHGLNIILDFNA